MIHVRKVTKNRELNILPFDDKVTKQKYCIIKLIEFTWRTSFAYKIIKIDMGHLYLPIHY